MPPQDALLERLERAGIDDPTLFDVLRSDPMIREQMLTLLVQKRIITLMQYAILFEGLENTRIDNL